MSKSVLEWIESNQEKFIEISNDIWSLAELGLFEEESAKLLADTLEEAGFTVERGVADMPTAFVASYGTEDPVIAILGEYDALPGLSQVAEPIKQPRKEGGPGHGCGHNLFGTACLAACLAVKEAIKSGKIKGTIRFYGTPAEENADGKGWMINAGVFDDVHICLTWHPWDLNFVIANNFQAMYNVVFQFKGQAAHAAGDPFNGRSALDAVELMNVGCNYLREHMIPDARIHYVITKGGQAPNIVPDKAEVWYYVRAPRVEDVKALYPRVVKVAEGAALMTETQVDVTLLGGSANMLPNETLENLLHEKMMDIGVPEFSEEDLDFARQIRQTFPENFFDNFLAVLPQDARPFFESFKDKEFCDVISPIFGRGITMGGSTDVGDVSWVTPLAQFAIACTTIGTPGHSWQSVAQAGMTIGHKGMLCAAKVLAIATIELMQTPELVEKARHEFEEKIKKTSFQSPLPDGARPPIEYYRSLYKNK
ncbi:MAG: amidohydrolase [Candidatus Heimdallarchaeota archaeon]|nr:MAG: amidohydrolase [Candidatus Heimdallarchaeota archaeon]